MQQRNRSIRNYPYQVIVLWTANTERFSDVRVGLNDTADNLLQSIKRNESEISPSTLFAVASILEEVFLSLIVYRNKYFRINKTFCNNQNIKNKISKNDAQK